MTDMVNEMPDFLFDADSHTYTLDGKPIPSLTLLLRTLSDRILSHIPDHEVVERARIRGTEAHKQIEAMNLGGGDRFESGYTMAWGQFLEDTGFKPTHTEYRSYHLPLYFACTIDVLGTLPSGKQMLIDIKTGTSYPHHPLQTAGQAMALSAHGICPRDVLRANVYIAPKGEGYDYKIDLHENEKDFKALESYINWHRVREEYV